MNNIEVKLKNIERFALQYRRTIVWSGIAIVILMILYPPWIFEVSKGGAVYRIDEKYGLLFSLPHIGYHIDSVRLFLQCVPIIIIVVFTFWISKGKEF